MKNDNTLLDRDTFREGVFKRDNYKCVICQEPAQDAHHILERRLFDNGGYYLNNGASLCGKHHIEAEMTTLSVETIREACNITTPVIPDHFYPDYRYDKWGNVILSNGQRLYGELMDDESVQKILKQGNVLSEFTNTTSYPRTYHLPWSPGATSDDKITHDLSFLETSEIIVTEKMDGENTTLTNTICHARSTDSYLSEPWQHYVKNLWSIIRMDIPEHYRLCGENMFAKHSIFYSELEDYFLGFSIWNNLTCLSWDETVEYYSLLNIPMVPILYRGKFDIDIIKSCWNEKMYDTREGYVIRTTDKFHLRDFRKCVAKFVRPNHVQSTHHWKRLPKIKNVLKLTFN